MCAGRFTPSRADVILMLITAHQVLALAASVMITLAIAHGYGRHSQYLSKANQVLALKYYTAFQCLSIVATGAGRAAFTLYLLNILRQERYLGWILWLIFTLQIIINIVSVATILAQCQDINSLWDAHVGTACWNPNVERIYGYVQCCTFIDLIRCACYRRTLTDTI